MTRKEYFNVLVEVVNTLESLTYEGEDIKEDTLEFLNNQINQLDKRSTSKKPTKKQIENEDFRKIVREVLAEVGKPMTIGELIKNPRLTQFSSQKMTSLVLGMDDVVRTVDKKQSCYSLVQDDPVEVVLDMVDVEGAIAEA